MRTIAMFEASQVSGGDLGDDTVCRLADDGGSTGGFTQNPVLNGAAGIAGAYLLGGPPGIALTAAVAAAQGIGQYNSAAGPGPGGTQNLPPSLPGYFP